jgi:hypothetical protein
MNNENENKSEQNKSLDTVAITKVLVDIKSTATKASLFGMSAFAMSLVILYNVASMQSQQNEIYTEAKSTILAVSPLAKGQIELNKKNPIYPTSGRAIAIAGSLSLLDIRPSDAQNYLMEVTEELKRDAEEQIFFTNVAAIGSPNVMVERVGDTKLKVFDKWVIDAGSEDSPLLSSFPRNPTLLMNHESVMYPKCEAGEVPILVYAKATKNNASWLEEPKIFEDDKLNRWVVLFGDLEPMDKTAFDRRLLVITDCNKSESQ